MPCVWVCVCLQDCQESCAVCADFEKSGAFCVLPCFCENECECVKLAQYICVCVCVCMSGHDFILLRLVCIWVCVRRSVCVRVITFAQFSVFLSVLVCWTHALGSINSLYCQTVVMCVLTLQKKNNYSQLYKFTNLHQICLITQRYKKWKPRNRICIIINQHWRVTNQN